MARKKKKEPQTTFEKSNEAGGRTIVHVAEGSPIGVVKSTEIKRK